MRICVAGSLIFTPLSMASETKGSDDETGGVEDLFLADEGFRTPQELLKNIKDSHSLRHRCVHQRSGVDVPVARHGPREIESLDRLVDRDTQ